MTQCEMIIKYLRQHRTITPIQAEDNFGIMRLGARIWDLRDIGYPIITETVKAKNRYGKKIIYAKYRLEKK